MIKLEKVNKYFNKNKKNEIHVIDNTSVSFDSTGLVCLLGPSGCGKTTLLNVIGGLDKVKSGKIYVNGKKITKKSTYYVDKERNLNIGYIFQNYNLLENLSVFDNVAIALKMVGVKNKNEIEKRVNFVLETLKIYRYRNRPAGMLSGGEKQRVAIARAIVKNPNILLCDEPTGNLDSQNTLEIMNIIKSISKNRLVILVTHENDIAKFYADRIIEVSDGKIIKDYENSYEGSLDYKIDNKIYLKDFKTKEENGNITLYFDNKIKSNITIIAKNNNIYIKTNGSEKIEVVDENSNIELINDHYKQIDKSIYEKYEFDFKNIETTKHKYSSIFNVFKVIFLGFKKILDYSFIKKLLLLGFLASGAFIMYAVSNTLGILNVKDSYFIEKNKNYLEVKMQKINIDNFGKYESLNGIDYILPGSGNANFKITFDNYYQTKNASSTISGTLVNKNYINDSDIIYGKKTNNDFDIVVDKSTLNKLFTGEEKIGIQTGYSVQDLIGYKVNCGDLIFTITGITDIGDYSIFTNKKYMIDILYNSLGTDETMVYDAESMVYDAEISDKYLNYKLIDNLSIKKGRLPENDYEVVININKEIDNPLNSKLENKINNKKLTVVGYYDGKNMLVNENMIKYELISKSKNLTIMPSDSEIAIESLNNENLNVVKSYDSAKEKYLDSRETVVKSGLIASGVILFISFVEIYLMIRSSYLSRIKEIGIYRAIGTKKSDIYKMFYGEIIAITTVASLPGILFTTYALKTLQTISYFEKNYLVNSFTIILSILIVYLFNIIVGLLPIIKIISKTPASILARKDVD